MTLGDGFAASSGPLDLVVALAVGLMIGLEREWRQRAADGGPHIGIRTFGLMGMFGGLAGLLEPQVGWLLPGSVLALALLLLSDRRRDQPAALAEDATTLVAALVTVLLGALATMGQPELAAAAAVVVTLLLNLKPTLHRWVGQLTGPELQAVIRLLVISLVVLPVLPDQGYGPYAALNPRSIWWFVVLMSALSFAGYLAIRILGSERGFLATGLFGGLVSSTATTAALAQLGRKAPKMGGTLAAGVAVANAVMAARMVVVTALIDPNLALAAAWPLGWAATVAAIMAVLLWRGHAEKIPADSLPMQNPFDLAPAIRFAILLAVMLVLARFLESEFGQTGIEVLAAVAGLVDVDAITLTVARGTAQGNPLSPAVAALLIAAFANSLLKGALLIGAGGKLARWGVAALALMAIAGLIGYLVPPPWSLV